ncbi:Protein CBG11256 [Caenorhabditis briggsae]|uniref:Protein CBG11256 n=1 Tax=Caenorhabditis briggsae TaxID=6238 RepID=A8XDF2_CAEBR|nr:Protein CBG11256 [Caenorhabditis briggsae]CAP30671.1 Protein CBG11256 [Caenorhabditis briggsae]
MNQMASSLGISRQSVQSIVKKDLGLNSYRLLRGQYLTEQSKKNRLEKAKKLLDALKVRRLSEVIWTDEKIFTVEPLPNRQNARQLLSKDEAKSPKRRLAYKRLFPKSVMVWAGLTSEAPDIVNKVIGILETWGAGRHRISRSKSFEQSGRDLLRTITFDASERGQESYKTAVVARQISVAPELAAHLRTIWIVQTTTEVLDHKDATLTTLRDVFSKIMDPVDVTPSNARQDDTRKDTNDVTQNRTTRGEWTPKM